MQWDRDQENRKYLNEAIAVITDASKDGMMKANKRRTDENGGMTKEKNECKTDMRMN